MAARSGYRSVTRVTICRARGHAAGKFVTRRPLSMHAHVDPPDPSRMHAYTPGMARPRLYRLVQSILEHMHIGN